MQKLRTGKTGWILDKLLDPGPSSPRISDIRMSRVGSTPSYFPKVICHQQTQKRGEGRYDSTFILRLQ